MKRKNEKDHQMPKMTKDKAITDVYHQIQDVLAHARSQAYHAVNIAMVQAYWNIGRIIVEEEQRGEERAEYGKSLIQELSVRLSSEFGRGFDKSNLWNMRAFFLAFPILGAVRRELSWTHYSPPVISYTCRAKRNLLRS